MKKLFKMFRSWWLRLKWWWTGGVLSAQLQDLASPVRTEAEEAVDRVVRETRVAPDCVAATILRGGTTIIIKHDGGNEAFIGYSYSHAATEAIKWLNLQEGRFIKHKGVSRMSEDRSKVVRTRAQRRYNQKQN